MRLELHEGQFVWSGIAGQLTTCGRPSAGNTGGRWFVDEAGVHWFVKADLYHAGLQSSAEVVSARILAQLGYPVPETHKLEVGGVQLSAARDVGEAVATTHFEGLDTPAVRELRVFAAYLCDWDRVAPRSQNNLVHADGRISLIDFGGTLGARALGRHKPGPVRFSSIGHFPGDLDGAAILANYRVEVAEGHPWLRLSAADLDAARAKLAGLEDPALAQIVEAASYPEPGAAEAMLAALQGRRDALLDGGG